eukprot:GILK01014948.1.p1 GENE.GILK01014948.1~~GILK01014948.1.p1  ORF type:complete len:423 (+),score=90.46 GILK01014948.1:46-1269(+)
MADEHQWEEVRPEDVQTLTERKIEQQLKAIMALQQGQRNLDEEVQRKFQEQIRIFKTNHAELIRAIDITSQRTVATQNQVHKQEQLIAKLLMAHEDIPDKFLTSVGTLEKRLSAALLAYQRKIEEALNAQTRLQEQSLKLKRSKDGSEKGRLQVQKHELQEKALLLGEKARELEFSLSRCEQKLQDLHNQEAELSKRETNLEQQWARLKKSESAFNKKDREMEILLNNLTNKQHELEQREQEWSTRNAALMAKEQHITSREHILRSKETACGKREQELQDKAKELAQKQIEIEAKTEQLIKQERALDLRQGVDEASSLTSFASSTTSPFKFVVGARVDALDSYGNWFPAEIVTVDSNLITVKFWNSVSNRFWSAKHNEVLVCRLAPPGSFTKTARSFRGTNPSQLEG